MLLRRLWTEPSVDHAGASDTVHAAGIAPLPPYPVPIWLGSGTDPRAVARVGRLADAPEAPGKAARRKISPGRSMNR